MKKTILIIAGIMVILIASLLALLITAYATKERDESAYPAIDTV